MATREELMGGLQFVPAQAKRVACWTRRTSGTPSEKRAGPRKMFTHVAATVGMMPKMGPNVLKAPPEADVTMALISQSSTSKASPQCARWTPKQAVETLSANCSKLSDWVKSLTDEQLESKHTFRGMPMPMSDLLMTVTVMHPIHHLYEASLPVHA